MNLKMLDYFKDRFYSFVDDRLQLLSLLGFIAICLFSILNYIKEPSLEWNMRIIIYGIGIFLTIILGNKGTWITWLLVSFVMFHFSHYRNISYFSILNILILFKPKFRYQLLFIYAVNVFVICHLHNLELMKVCFHLSCCGFIYGSVNEIVRRVKSLMKKELELTEDEKIILEYLSKGIQQNDIIEWTPQTVSRKLRQAKIRNGIENTEKLTEEYKKHFAS